MTDEEKSANGFGWLARRSQIDRLKSSATQFTPNSLFSQHGA
jgi:hypothetical protein